jgi:translation initiation factor IF-1
MFAASVDPVKEEGILLEGVVEEALPGLDFAVRLDNGHLVRAYVSGKMRRHRIRISRGIGGRWSCRRMTCEAVVSRTGSDSGDHRRRGGPPWAIGADMWP